MRAWVMSLLWFLPLLLATEWIYHIFSLHHLGLARHVHETPLCINNNRSRVSRVFFFLSLSSSAILHSNVCVSTPFVYSRCSEVTSDLRYSAWEPERAIFSCTARKWEMFILSLSSCARPRSFRWQEGIASVIMRKYYTAKHATIYIICYGITGNERIQLRKKSQNQCVVSCKTETLDTDGVSELKFQTKISFFLSKPTPASVKTSKSSNLVAFAFSVILNAFHFGWQKTCELGLTSPKVILCG